MDFRTKGNNPKSNILKKGYAGNYDGKYKLNIEYIDDYVKGDREKQGTFTNIIFKACKHGTPSCCEKVKSFLKNIIPKGSIVCTVPSSTAGKTGHLDIMLKELSNECGFMVLPLIVRSMSKEKKAAFGGDRSLTGQYRTLECAPKSEIEGKSIIIIDDISTTGNSLFACKKILEKNGARNVRTIVLGRTK